MQIIEISAARPQNIAIGRCTENGVTQVKIDLSEITQKHPDLTRFEVLVKNPSGVTYPALTERQDTALIWNVTAADTATAGKGFYEIAAYGENGEKKLAPYAAFVISGSLDAHRTETPPDPAKGYVEKVLSAAAAAEEAAKRAEEAAEKAESGGTVNPDSPGGEITPGAIKEAVAEYLTENPPPAGPEGPEGPQGPAGPQGPEGPQGPQGESGVHVGADMPPNGEDVWIDPTGAPWQLPVASANTLGGVKVGKGLQMDGDVLGVSKELFEHIADIVIDEERVTSVIISTEPNGVEFNFEALRVIVETQPADAQYAGYVIAYADTLPSNARLAGAYYATMCTTEVRTSNFIAFPLYGAWHGFCFGSGSSETQNANVYNYPGLNGKRKTKDYPAIKCIEVKVAAGIPKDSIIHIEGVRYNAKNLH